MKHGFSKQAAEVKRLSKLVLKVDQEILREAATSLNALALIGEKKILIVEDLIRVAQDYVIDAPAIDLERVIFYQNEFRKLLDKIK